MDNKDRGTALVVGVSGIVGQAAAQLLVKEGWDVVGMARSPGVLEGGRTLSVDLLNAQQVADRLRTLKVSYVFFCTWSKQDTEKQNIEVNGPMLENLLFALASQQNLKHVALVTGTRHYLGTFDGAQAQVETPFREEAPPLETEHFYYVWERALRIQAEEQGYTWSVHRPQPVIGYAIGAAMNTAASIAVYASICKEFALPFIYPGTEFHWNNLTDVSDARQVAHQLAWAAVTPASADQAYNVVNGDIFRWRWLWPEIAKYFDLESLPPTNPPFLLQTSMANAQQRWSAIVRKYDLAESDITRLSTWWFADWDLGRDALAITDMSKSRRHGFKEYQYTVDSFTDVFDQMRGQRLIP